MGWVWRDDGNGDLHPPSTAGGEVSEFHNTNTSKNSGEACSTRRVVKSRCRTEEVEGGKFVRKCEKTEEIIRDCLGKPVEVLKSEKEYTEDDVTDMVAKGSYGFGKSENGSDPFDFPGLRSDIEGIERHFFGGINRFFEAADEMKNNFFNVFRDFYDGDSLSSETTRQGIPIEGQPQMEASIRKPNQPESGEVDLSSFVRDV